MIKYVVFYLLDKPNIIFLILLRYNILILLYNNNSSNRLKNKKLKIIIFFYLTNLNHLYSSFYKLIITFLKKIYF